MNDSSKLFESLAVESCFELNQPGKALVLLIEALQNRQIHALQCRGKQGVQPQNYGLNLPWVALEAAEQSLYGGLKTALPEERGERMRALC